MTMPHDWREAALNKLAKLDAAATAASEYLTARREGAAHLHLNLVNARNALADAERRLQHVQFAATGSSIDPYADAIEGFRERVRDAERALDRYNQATEAATPTCDAALRGKLQSVAKKLGLLDGQASQVAL